MVISVKLAVLLFVKFVQRIAIIDVVKQNAIKNVVKYAINAIINAKINANIVNALNYAMRYAINLFVMNLVIKN